MTDQGIGNNQENSITPVAGEVVEPVASVGGAETTGPKNLKINGSVATNGATEQKVESKDVKKLIDMPSNRKNLAVVVFLAVVFAGFLAGVTYFLSQ